ncbi:MAG: insulinase family protein [Ignavibacteria bacterium]|nr:insulinase family protein [Ignavibacteria bacterium]
MPKISYKQIELENGLKAVLSRNENIPSVIISVSFKAGSKDEPRDKKGLAHLLEHLMFSGVCRDNLKSFDEILSLMGGESNAYTSQDMTSYFISIPSGMLECAMQLDSVRLNALDFSDGNIEIQKKVVIEEKNQIYDNVPFGSLEFEIGRRLFKNTPYEIPVIGKTESIKGITAEDISGFYEKFYNTGNGVIAVCGDIDMVETENFLNKYYSDIKKDKPKNSIGNFKIEDFSCGKYVIKDKINLPAVFINFRIPEFGTVNYYAAKHIAGLLTGGDSSILNRELIYDKNLCFEAESSVTGFEKAGMFGIDAYLNHGADCSEVEQIITENLNLICRGGFGERDIEKIKNKIELSYHTALQTNLAVSDNLSYFTLFTESPGRINYEIENALKITRDDIVETMREYINPEKMLILNYLPST